MKAKCDAGNFEPLKEIGLTLPHEIFAVFT